MNPAVNTIANRLSLRSPQRISLEILARICDIISLEKGADGCARVISAGVQPIVADRGAVREQVVAGPRECR